MPPGYLLNLYENLLFHLEKMLEGVSERNRDELKKMIIRRRCICLTKDTGISEDFMISKGLVA
jgi:hypothetical protein